MNKRKKNKNKNNITQKMTRAIGIGKGGAKRHRKVLRNSILDITKNSIKRIARRGGVRCISGEVYEDI